MEHIRSSFDRKNKEARNIANLVGESPRPVEWFVPISVHKEDPTAPFSKTNNAFNGTNPHGLLFGSNKDYAGLNYILNLDVESTLKRASNKMDWDINLKPTLKYFEDTFSRKELDKNEDDFDYEEKAPSFMYDLAKELDPGAQDAVGQVGNFIATIMQEHVQHFKHERSEKTLLNRISSFGTTWMYLRTLTSMYQPIVQMASPSLTYMLKRAFHLDFNSSAS